MIPDTWLPTFTVVTADSVPVAVTVATTSPLSSFAFRYFGSDEPLRASTNHAPAPITTTAATTARILFFIQPSNGVGRRNSRSGLREISERHRQAQLERLDGAGRRGRPQPPRTVLDRSRDALHGRPHGARHVDLLDGLGPDVVPARPGVAVRHARELGPEPREGRAGVVVPVAAGAPRRAPLARPPEALHEDRERAERRRQVRREVAAAELARAVLRDEARARGRDPRAHGPQDPVQREARAARQRVPELARRVRLDVPPLLFPAHMVVLTHEGGRPGERVEGPPRLAVQLRAPARVARHAVEREEGARKRLVREADARHDLARAHGTRGRLHRDPPLLEPDAAREERPERPFRAPHLGAGRDDAPREVRRDAGPVELGDPRVAVREGLVVVEDRLEPELRKGPGVLRGILRGRGSRRETEEDGREGGGQETLQDSRVYYEARVPRDTGGRQFPKISKSRISSSASRTA